MALGWLTVLKMLPWDDVIKNAPRVADGAKNLWRAVAKKPPGPEAHQHHPPRHSAGEPSLPQLQQQLDTAMSEIATLHQQMLESSALIQALAEQNAQLIKRVETYRVRVWILGIATGLTVIALGVVAALAGLT